MRNFLLALMTFVAAVLAGTLVIVGNQPDLSTLEIDRDRAAIKAEISEAEAESRTFSGGSIKAFIDLRIAILRNTLSMLDQKRASYIRRIALTYKINGQPVLEASNAELQDILQELSQAEKMVVESKQEVARYSGGLLQSMALLKAATDELNVSQLRLKFYSAKYGIPLPVVAPDSNSPGRESSKPAQRIPGKVVRDREAL